MMTEASTLPGAADAGPGAAALMADGYAIVRSAAPAELIAAIDSDFGARFAATPFCEGDFYGRSTKRFGRLLIRSPHVAALVMNPAILAFAEAALGRWCERLQLNLAQAIELHPGAPAQFPHRDQNLLSEQAPPPLARWLGHAQRPPGRMGNIYQTKQVLTPGTVRLRPDAHRP